MSQGLFFCYIISFCKHHGGARRTLNLWRDAAERVLLTICLHLLMHGSRLVFCYIISICKHHGGARRTLNLRRDAAEIVLRRDKRLTYFTLLISISISHLNNPIWQLGCGTMLIFSQVAGQDSPSLPRVPRILNLLKF